MPSNTNETEGPYCEAEEMKREAFFKPISQQSFSSLVEGKISPYSDELTVKILYHLRFARMKHSLVQARNEDQVTPGQMPSFVRVANDPFLKLSSAMVALYDPKFERVLSSSTSSAFLLSKFQHQILVTATLCAKRMIYDITTSTFPGSVQQSFANLRYFLRPTLEALKPLLLNVEQLESGCSRQLVSNLGLCPHSVGLATI
ncbi:hypothetical protein JCM8547_007480 [Rhodosporidiobolus lusitaniae]